MHRNVYDVLQERGFIEDQTHENLRAILETPLKLYCGFDPTADSLHLGNYIGLMVLAWFQKMGHTPVVIVGGATGLIGDPSGKSAERPLLDKQSLEENLKGIERNLRKVLNFEGSNRPIILNNATWYENFSFLDFLRDIGKHFRLGPMLSKETVKTRLASPEGMSFKEFCYPLLQGYDFLHLFEKEGVTLQIGGSDQWANITAGVELTRKVIQKEVYGLTFKLLTRSDGKKFGKSEGGAIWLAEEKLSPYDFYQYLIRVPDADVIGMLKLLTFVNLKEIEKLEKDMKEPGYVPNTAQKKLAKEVTQIVHGIQKTEEALHISEKLKPGHETSLDGKTLESLCDQAVEIGKSELLGQKLIDVLVLTGFVSSKSEARRLMAGGGFYLNNERISDEQKIILMQDLIEGSYLLLAQGKKRKILVKGIL